VEFTSVDCNKNSSKKYEVHLTYKDSTVGVVTFSDKLLADEYVDFKTKRPTKVVEVGKVPEKKEISDAFWELAKTQAETLTLVGVLNEGVDGFEIEFGNAQKA